MRAPGRHDRNWDNEPEDDDLPEADEESPYSPEVNAYWEEFQATTYSGKVAMFTRAVDEKDLLDDQLAFDMLDQLFLASIERGPDERERFDHLVGSMRKHRPELYEPNAVYILPWLIDNALATGRTDALPPLAAELADRAGAEPDLFTRCVEHFAYHGQLKVLVDMMRQAWSHPAAGHDRPDWAEPEDAQRGADYEVLLRLEEDPNADAHDPVLVGRVGQFLRAVQPEHLANRLERLAGRRKDPWKPADFDMLVSKGEAGRKVKLSKQERGRLFDLGSEFVGWLRRREGVPYPKGELAAGGLVQYFLARAGGDLRHGGAPATPLCPDAPSLDDFLGQGMAPFALGQHRAAATFELVPAWLRFLEERQLLTAEQRRQTIQGLRRLGAQLTDYFEDYKIDPNLFKALEAWCEAAASP
jgi:hypothetical protein